MMPRLFWKIFLWFWLTMVLTAGATFLWSSLDAEKRNSATRQLAEMESLANAVTAILDEHGKRELRPWLRHVQERTHAHIIIVDMKSKKSLTRHPLPRSLQAHIQESNPQSNHFIAHGPRGESLSIPIHDAHGDYYRLIAFMPNPSVNGAPHHLRSILFDLSHSLWIALPVTALICMLFAYILVRPIRQLQHTARLLGEGDLSIRSPLATRHDEVGQLANEFNEMANRIEYTLNQQQQLLRDVSHELRSPLARLRVALELARKQSGETVQLQRIENETACMDGMIEHILTLIRLEQGSAHQPLPKPFNIISLIEDIVINANFEYAKASKQAYIDAPIDDITIQGDSRILHSAIENIVRNAMHYTPANSQVSIQISTNSKQATIIITDAGSGVPETSLAHLFEPFYRVDAARDRQSGGFGLGLSIAARAIQSHHGSIRAENAKTGGLSVSMTFPIMNKSIADKELGENA